jgi:hypothetical protein
MYFTEEHKEKLRQAKLRNPVRYWLGKKRPNLKNVGSFKTMFKKGQTSWLKGKEFLAISKENHPMWKGGLPKCLICKKRLSNYNSKYCSKHKGILWSGEKNYHWKGGKYSENYRQRRRFRDEMQKTIFERDNYTCQLCGIKGVYLQVDHIQPWVKYVELRFDVNNCRTLCMKCHYKITFGKPMPKNVKRWGHNFERRKLQFRI